ncbi:MAG: AI-2E family transporter, partial [Anaerotignum sp.]|nr:AI-2E family transporter [Anaerotignum sp.]
MELNQETIRKIRGLIVFTLLLLVGLWRFDVVWSAFRFLLGVLLPLLLGCAIAFVLSVPMSRIQKRFFANARNGSKAEKLAQPLSLVLALLLVAAILGLVVAVVLPELGSTITTLSHTLPQKVPTLFSKLESLFMNNPQLVQYIEALESTLNWEEIFNQLIHFFRFGANTMLDSTISAAKGIVSGIGTFVIAFTFACYILLQYETLGRQCRKLLYAFLKQKHADEVVRI